MNFAWRKWKLGVGVALFLSLLAAGSGLAAGMKWQAFVAVLCSATLTHLVAFLKDHPVDAVTFDEEAQKTDPPMKKLPLLFALILALACGLVATGCQNSGQTAAVTAQQVAYRAYAGSGVSVPAALQMYDAYIKVNHHHPATASELSEEAAVKSAFEKWQSAMALAGDAGAIYAASGSSTNGLAALTAFEQAVSNADATKNDVLDVIQKFTH